MALLLRDHNRSGGMKSVNRLSPRWKLWGFNRVHRLFGEAGAARPLYSQFCRPKASNNLSRASHELAGSGLVPVLP